MPTWLDSLYCSEGISRINTVKKGAYFRNPYLKHIKGQKFKPRGLQGDKPMPSQKSNFCLCHCGVAVRTQIVFPRMYVNTQFGIKFQTPLLVYYANIDSAPNYVTPVCNFTPFCLARRMLLIVHAGLIAY